MGDGGTVFADLFLGIHHHHFLRGEASASGIIVPGDYGRTIVAGLFADK